MDSDDVERDDPDDFERWDSVASLGRYLWAFSRLEFSVARLAIALVAYSSGIGSAANERSFRAASLVVGRLSFAGLVNAAGDLVAQRFTTPEMHDEWKALAKKCWSENDDRNRYVHSHLFASDEPGSAFTSVRHQVKVTEITLEELERRTNALARLARAISEFQRELLADE